MSEERNLRALLDRLPDNIKNNFDKIGRLFNKNNPPSIDYQPHHLLLIIPANQASFLQNEEKLISVEQLHSLINGATSAYCFKDSDKKGSELLSTFDYSEKEPEFISNELILVHLILSANESIIGENTGLNIKNKIEPNTDKIQVKKFGKLKSARPTLDFYDLY